MKIDALIRPALAAATAVGLFVTPAQAGAVDEVRGGVSIQSLGPISPNVEDGLAISGEVLFAAPEFLAKIGAPRPHIGFSAATDGAATSYGYLGLTWRATMFAEGGFLEFGVGGAVHNGRTSYNPIADEPRQGEAFLGCRALVRLHVAPGVRLSERWTASLQWEHLSNANLCGENEGLDNLGVRFGYRF